MRRHIVGAAGTALGLARPPAIAGAGAGGAARLAHLMQQQHPLSASSSAAAASAGASLVGVTGARAPLRWAAGAAAALRAFSARSSAAAAAPDPNAPTPNSQMQDDFLSGTSASYLESLEDKFREDPNSVPASWAAFLRQMGAQARRAPRPCPSPLLIPPLLALLSYRAMPRSTLPHRDGRDGHDLTPPATPPSQLRAFSRFHVFSFFVSFREDIFPNLPHCCI